MNTMNGDGPRTAAGRAMATPWFLVEGLRRLMNGWFEQQVQGQYVIIGPSGSGKTTLLGSLQQAALNCSWEDEPIAVRLRPVSDAMRELQAACASVVDLGRFAVNATTSVEEYVFQLSVEMPLIGPLTQGVTARFCMYDGPGGAMFQTAGAAAGASQLGPDRERMLQQLREASGFVLCVDSCNPGNARLFFRELPRLLAQLGCDTLPHDGVLICLTKADSYFRSRARRALESARAEDPIAHARALLSRVGVNALKSYCKPDTEIGFVWTSAYGFLEGEGTANLDPAAESLLRAPGGCYSAADIIDAWQPFQVLDPFIYVATGHKGSVKCIPAEEL